MARFVKGDVVVIPFPFSDLTHFKKRPALVISSLEGDDIILCQITSQAIKDKYAIQLSEQDFSEGSLKRRSNIRPNRIFTADRHIVIYRVGNIKREKVKEVIERTIEIIRT